MLKKIQTMIVVLFLTSTFSLTACGTIEGVGKDMQTAGEAVQDVANNNK